MNEHIPHLSIETLGNGNLRLENESMGDSYAVDLHPIHVRLLAERLSLIAKPFESNADEPTFAEQARDIDRLKRNMLRVRQHALELQCKFANDADWKHADLTFEMGLINTLVDLLDMAVDDFADNFTSHDPEPYLPALQIDAQSGSPHRFRTKAEKGQAGEQLEFVEKEDAK
jgi:hypothetical protein